MTSFYGIQVGAGNLEIPRTADTRFGWSHFSVYEFVVLAANRFYFALVMLSIVYLHLPFAGTIKDEPEGGKDVWWCLADGGTLEYVFETRHDYPTLFRPSGKALNRAEGSDSGLNGVI